MARPSKYTEKLTSDFCARLAEGKTVREVCKSKDMPGMSTVFRWLGDPEKYPGFREQYKAALYQSLQSMADEIIEIADESGLDVTIDEEGKVVVNGETVQRAKIRIESRKWILSRRLPKEYGDKVTQEFSGPDGGPIEGKIEVVLIPAKRE